MTTGQEPLAAPFPEEGAVAAVFGNGQERARRFVDHLTTSGVDRGLVGPREVPRIWTRHVLNCAVVGELIGADATVCDVGSGAGLPGVALALSRPDLEVVLVEPLLRRVTWLHEVIDDLGLERVRVVRGRAEDVVGTVRADVAVARAVAQLDVLARWCLPLLYPGGKLLAIKGRSAGEELAAGQETLERLGATDWHIVRSGEGTLAEPTTVVEIVAGSGPAREGTTTRTRADGGRRRRGRGGQTGSGRSGG